jgi:hypothetical protein
MIHVRKHRVSRLAATRVEQSNLSHNFLEQGNCHEARLICPFICQIRVKLRFMKFLLSHLIGNADTGVMDGKKTSAFGQNYWVSGLRPSSGIVNTGKHNVSETGSASVLRRGEGDIYSVGHPHRGMVSLHGVRGSVVVKALCYKPEGRRLPNFFGRTRLWSLLSRQQKWIPET